MRIYKIASVSDSDFKDLKQRVDKVKDDVGDIKRDVKDTKKLEDRVKELEKIIKDLNVGQRRFWQNQTVFTTLQRKIENFEKVQQEWKFYKEEMDSKIKREVERSTRVQVKV